MAPTDRPLSRTTSATVDPRYPFWLNTETAASTIRRRISCSCAAETRGIRGRLQGERVLCSPYRTLDECASNSELTKRMLILYRRGTRNAKAEGADVQPMGSVRLPLPPSDSSHRRRHRTRVTDAGVAGIQRPQLRRLARQRI